MSTMINVKTKRVKWRFMMLAAC